jgi:hypothetical protein
MKKCPICKKIKPNKEVKKRINPFQQEMSGTIVKQEMCDDCENNSAMDI